MLFTCFFTNHTNSFPDDDAAEKLTPASPRSTESSFAIAEGLQNAKYVKALGEIVREGKDTLLIDFLDVQKLDDNLAHAILTDYYRSVSDIS